MDNSNNLTIKTLSMLTWYGRECDQVPYILKTDGDTYINVENLYKFVSTNDNPDLITGFLHSDDDPFTETDPKHKYLNPGHPHPNHLRQCS